MSQWTDEQARERFYAERHKHDHDAIGIGRALLDLEAERDKLVEANGEMSRVSAEWARRLVEADARVKELEQEREVGVEFWRASAIEHWRHTLVAERDAALRAEVERMRAEKP